MLIQVKKNEVRFKMEPIIVILDNSLTNDELLINKEYYEKIF